MRALFITVLLPIAAAPTVAQVPLGAVRVSCDHLPQTEGRWQGCVWDGDTVYGALTIMPHPLTRVTSSVKLAGIDTPELRGRCDAERQKAREARTALRNMVASMEETHVFALQFAEDADSSGRQLGWILGYPLDRNGAVSSNGRAIDLNQWMIYQGHAVEYGVEHNWRASS